MENSILDSRESKYGTPLMMSTNLRKSAYKQKVKSDILGGY